MRARHPVARGLTVDPCGPFAQIVFLTFAVAHGAFTYARDANLELGERIMTDAVVPPIPLSLQHLPTVGGLVVPWITPRTADGRYLFGSVDRDRMRQALRSRWCGVCGQPLGYRAVLMMRLSDLPRQCTSEPALHPWCAAYTSESCPMIGGRLDHYRSSIPRLDTNMLPAPDATARQGAAAEPWFAVWLAAYRVITDHGNLAASYAGTKPLRIRPITWRLPNIF
jgi:hypothetical protein